MSNPETDLNFYERDDRKAYEQMVDLTDHIYNADSERPFPQRFPDFIELLLVTAHNFFYLTKTSFFVLAGLPGSGKTSTFNVI
jgi:hypothetical protein